MKMLGITGPSTLPWDAPQIISLWLDFVPLITTL